jgi:hypothetical protein
MRITGQAVCSRSRTAGEAAILRVVYICERGIIRCFTREALYGVLRERHYTVFCEIGIISCERYPAREALYPARGALPVYRARDILREYERHSMRGILRGESCERNLIKAIVPVREYEKYSMRDILRERGTLRETFYEEILARGILSYKRNTTRVREVSYEKYPARGILRERGILRGEFCERNTTRV